MLLFQGVSGPDPTVVRFKRPTGCSFGQQIPPRKSSKFLRNLRVFCVCLLCCSKNSRGNFLQYSTTKLLGFPWWLFVAFFRSNTPFFLVGGFSPTPALKKYAQVKLDLIPRDRGEYIPKMLQTKPPASFLMCCLFNSLRIQTPPGFS